jgi:hypothetical protein
MSLGPGQDAETDRGGLAALVTPDKSPILAADRAEPQGPLETRTSAFVFVNNRLEGNAPSTKAKREGKKVSGTISSFLGQKKVSGTVFELFGVEQHNTCIGLSRSPIEGQSSSSALAGLLQANRRHHVS